MNSIGDLTLNDALTAIASKTPSPGGGAVAAVVEALAASLAQMVVNYSIGKKSLAAHAATHQNSLTTLQQLSQTALELADQDARAYERLNELLRLDENDSRRQRDRPAAVDAAIAVPLELLNRCVATLQLLQQLTHVTNPALASDLAIAAILAEAAGRAAAWNVRINLPLVADETRRAQQEASIDSTIADLERECRALELSCRSRK